MFLTITPLLFSPLWELFFNQNNQTKIHQNQNLESYNNLYNIYIHADPNQTYNSPFTCVFNNRIIPSSKPTKRFTPSLISAALRLLSHALIHDSSNSMFALISSTCIPLHSFNFTYNTLIRSKKSFIEILPNEPGAYDRWIARGLDIMLPEILFDKFHVGSQFFVLTRKHALIRCIPATLTHFDWHGRSDGHPHTCEASEVDHELIIKLRSDKPKYGTDAGSNDNDTKRINGSDSLRKFSPDSLQPLMDIAKHIIFKDFLI
ncbi:hypothetical protein MKX01_001502 [Papaver californicum]|nr:hypothetical protein MKX01_001502 [Papaver californicum]